MAITAEKTRINLKYLSDPDGLHEAALTADYDPGLLSQDSEVYSPSLARIAAALSFAAAKGDVLCSNLAALGYGEIGMADFENRRPDRIGLCIARMRTGSHERVAVILRGTRGEEWYSNFELGYAAEHKGFMKAADFAEERLGEFLLTRGVDVPELFITGYSRGGAVANLLAKRMCDRYGIDAVRCYTFAAPNTAVTFRATRYGSIFNLVRDEDFFARVPLTGWGYTKYGHILFMGGDVSERWQQITGEEYIGLKDSAAADDALAAALRLAPSVHAYYERRYPIGNRRLSLFGFMHFVADMLAGHMDEHFVEMMADAADTEFAALADFLSRGADIASLFLTDTGAPRCSLSDSHSPAAYMAAMEASASLW